MHGGTCTETTFANERCGTSINFVRDFFMVAPFGFGDRLHTTCRQKEPPPSTHPFDKFRDIPRARSYRVSKSHDCLSYLCCVHPVGLALN